MNLIHHIGKTLRRNSRTILTGVAIVGTGLTAAMAVRDTLRASDVILEYKMQHDIGEISTVELVKQVAPCYIPTAMAVTGTVAAIVGSYTTSSTKIAAVTSAYSMAQEAASVYRQKVREIVGTEKAKEIESSIHDDQIAKADSTIKTIVVGTGEVLFLDAYTGRPFASTMNKVEKARNDINYELLGNSYVTLNEFYAKLGSLDPIPSGDNIGWNNDHQVDLEFDSKIIDDGRPCIIMSFKYQPTEAALTLL